jgi:hypothetical protein
MSSERQNKYSDENAARPFETLVNYYYSIYYGKRTTIKYINIQPHNNPLHVSNFTDHFQG